MAAALQAAFTDVQCSGYLLSAATPPCFEISPEAVDYDLAFNRGHDQHTFVVRGIVGNTSDIGAQKTLDEWAEKSGATSVKAALEADRTLGGACQTLQVTGLSNYRTFGAAASQSNVTYLGAEWTVEVLV